jgi:hypothetical protein
MVEPQAVVEWVESSEALWLICEACKKPICDVSAGDSFQSLALTVRNHRCDDTNQ